MADPVKWRKGTIIEFDETTGESVVDVGGSNIVAIPLLGIAEAATYEAGASVGILVVETGGSQSWFILGRIARPSTAEYARALTRLGDATQADFDSATGTLTGGAAYIDLSGAAVGPQVSVNVGLSGKLLVTVGCLAEYDNGPGPAPFDQIMGFRMTTAATGANAWSGDGQWALIHYDQSLDTTTKRNGGTRASAVHLFEGLNPGLTTITCKYNMPTLGGTGTARDRLLVAQAL